MPPSPCTTSRSARRRFPLRLLLCCCTLLLLSRPAAPYSVLTHEELIDLTWVHSIRPILISRYPRLSESQLREAHAYAFGGCAIQDLGYYPFGHASFSNLTHYVRSGDFVLNLIRDSRNANELAFAIGALSHYIGDSVGHPEVINPSVAVSFPELVPRYGPVITYEDNKHDHVRTEFAFDVNEISKRNFAPAEYLDHVGLQVPESLLRRAFFETYGLQMGHSLGYKKRILPGYQFAVRKLIPRVADAEVLLHKSNMPVDTPSDSFKNMKSDLAQADFENGWRKYHRAPGVRAHILAAFIFILPKVGPLSDLAIRGPISSTQDLYVQSLNRSVAALRRVLQNFNTLSAPLPNLDLDTGSRTRPGAYRLTDQTYADLVHRLAHGSRRSLPPGIREDIAIYYSDPAETTTASDPRRMAELEKDLQILQSMPVDN